MKLAKILEIHFKQASIFVSNIPAGLEGNLGDNFLLQNNFIYRQIRSLALKANGKYSDAYDNKYAALSLGQLDRILQTKVVPYFNNVDVLMDIEKRIPGTTIWDEVTDNIKRNYLFHESCHLVARQIVKQYFTSSEPFEKMIVLSLLEESFANACELLSVIDVDDEIHRVFFEMNSFVVMFEDRGNLKNLVKRIGLLSTIQFFVFCYLTANFQNERLDEKEFIKVMDLLRVDLGHSHLQNLDAKVLKSLRVLAKIVFELNPRFRTVTTGFYLRLSGLRVTSEKIRKVDFLKIIQDDSRFIKLIHDLSNSVVN